VIWKKKAKKALKMAQAPMTVDRAKLILKETIALFGIPENKARLGTFVTSYANITHTPPRSAAQRLMI
jgi:hypothetical protein